MNKQIITNIFRLTVYDRKSVFHYIIVSERKKTERSKNMSDDKKSEDEPNYTLFQKEEKGELIENIKEKLMTLIKFGSA